jgi:serine-type D-Ala-D-Ala carboxypeptidase/endopeptidase (penicillin-binding protein 4)
MGNLTGRSRFGAVAVAIAVAAIPATASAAPRAHSAAEALRTALDRRMAAAGPASGAYVFDMTANRVLFGRRQGARRRLASNTKLFTTAAALERFGAGTRLRTSVWASGQMVPRLRAAGAGGTSPTQAYELNGSLYLKGGGDPALGTVAFANRYLEGLVTQAISLADEVRAAGIREVSGRIHADDSLFDRLRGVPYSNFRLTSYIGPLSALAFNSGYAGDLARRFSPDPARRAAEELRRALVRRGVHVPKGVALRRAPTSGTQLLAKVDSPPMQDLVRETNRESNNFFAEMLAKGLGAKFGGRGTTAAGARVVRTFAGTLGSRISNYDGSGLTHANAASPRAVVALLRAMRNRPSYAPFFGSLPIAGRQGTLRKRMRGTPAQDACRAKTGTVNYVSTLSGYCRTASRHDVVFSILMNGVNVYAARRLQDQMAARIANYRG